MGRAFLILLGATLLAALAAQASAAPDSTIETVDTYEEEMGLEGNWSAQGEYTADREEIRAYAWTYNLTPQQALEVIEFQEATSAGLAALEASIGRDRFAEAAFTGGQKELVIHVTETEQQDADLLTLVTEDLRDGTVTIQADAVYSLNERWAIQKASETPVVVDAVTGEVRPAEPSFAAATCQSLTGRATDGGRLVRWDDNSGFDDVRSDNYNGWTDCEAISSGHGLRCTNAFSVTKNGWQGYLTAGHCGQSTETSTHIWTEMYAYNMRLAYAKHRFYVEEISYDADAQMNREVYASTALNNQIYLDEEDGFQTIWNVKAGAPAINQWLCVKNAMPPSMPFIGWTLNDDTAGRWCGEVTDSYSWIYNGYNWADIEVGQWYKLRNRFHTAGGSGGPVYSSTWAYGMITHAFDYINSYEGVPYYGGAQFMHITAVESELGVDIYTG